MSASRLAFAFLGLLSLFCVERPAQAVDRIVDEAKVGALAHDVGFLGDHRESGWDINGEILFTSPGFLQWAFAPRPHHGASINTDGNTDQAYAGLTWTILGRNGIWSNNDIFANFAFGPSLNNGKTYTADPNRKALGSHILFRESLEFGYWFLPNTNASIYLDHISNAGLARPNEGLTNAGVRIGYQF